MASSDFSRLMDRLLNLETFLSQIAHKVNSGIDITLHHSHDAALTAAISQLVQQGVKMSGELAKLTEEVAEIKGKSNSLIALVQGLGDIIRANVDNGPALLSLANDLDAQSGKIQTVIDANPLPSEVPPVVTVIALPDAVLGSPYQATLEPIPGTAPFANTLGATAPDWLVADSSAPTVYSRPAVAGTDGQPGQPAAVADRIGSFEFDWTTTDSDPESPDVTRRYSLNVV